MIYRIDVRTAPSARGGEGATDPVGQALRHQIEEFGFGGVSVGGIETSRIFLIDADAHAPAVPHVANALLADPIVESAEAVRPWAGATGKSRIEVHLKPGVMDPIAATTKLALEGLGLKVNAVRTGRAYVFDRDVPRSQLEQIAARVLANGVIESVHFDTFVPTHFEQGKPYLLRLRHVDLLQLSDEQLTRLSREGHLFLSLVEMREVQAYFRERGREPTDIELETIAQTWSEHCVHKTLKSSVDVTEADAGGNIISKRRYGNLIRDTIFASTQQLMQTIKGGFCLSVFKDNAGVIAFDETDAVCFKVETHNHPSAIEPYGGSATGAGGCIRDVLGTGLSARPIANTDIFCVANARQQSLPKGVIHPKRVLQQVVAGVRDYGNRMGIPTVNGAVYFDDRYIGNPLVFCGCVGVIPRDKIGKAAQAGDAIVVMGGRTGRDGIHGATFSSAELTDTHADEFSHAVQIGNAITQKKMADVILAARDRGLFTAVTDCGAGGLSSAVGEMGEKLGAEVDLDRVPLKYAGLRHDEIWISEAQERMVLSVPGTQVAELLAMAAAEDVEATVVGTFGTPGRELILRYAGTEVGRLTMAFLHDGVPMPTRAAIVPARQPHLAPGESPGAKWAAARSNVASHLLAALAHPNIASKHWIIRQYDHEVQGGSVIKPLVGPMQIGPSDASVIRPKLGSTRGVVLSCGLAPAVEHPYDMAIAAIDEAIRNAVCVGADFDQLAILDNFCWPSVDDERTMGTLVAACEACRDAALAFGVPFISGKDSLHNQFTNGETGEITRIPRTLLISAIGIVPDVRRCVTMDFKSAGNGVYLIAANQPDNLAHLAAAHRAVASLIAGGAVAACHDVSDGGVAVALAEMCIASGLGCEAVEAAADPGEQPGRYIVEIRGDTPPALEAAAVTRLGSVTRAATLTIGDQNIDVQTLAAAWRGTLDW